MERDVKVWRKLGELQWRWEATHRRPGEERMTLRGRAVSRRRAERAARRALMEMAR